MFRPFRFPQDFRSLTNDQANLIINRPSILLHLRNTQLTPPFPGVEESVSGKYPLGLPTYNTAPLLDSKVPGYRLGF